MRAGWGFPRPEPRRRLTKGHQLLADRWPGREAVATATTHLEKANPMRQLVIGALVVDACRSGGL